MMSAFFWFENTKITCLTEQSSFGTVPHVFSHKRTLVIANILLTGPLSVPDASKSPALILHPVME